MIGKYGIHLIWLVLISCSAQKSQVREANALDTPDQYLTLLIQDNYAPTDAEELMVIEDSKSLSKFFTAINRTRKPGIPVPNIDFTQDIVIIHCQGSVQPNEVKVLRTKGETSEQLIIKAIGQELPVQEADTGATVRPFSVYRTPISDKEIILEHDR